MIYIFYISNPELDNPRVIGPLKEPGIVASLRVGLILPAPLPPPRMLHVQWYRRISIHGSHLRHGSPMST